MGVLSDNAETGTSQLSSSLPMGVCAWVETHLMKLPPPLPAGGQRNNPCPWPLPVNSQVGWGAPWEISPGWEGTTSHLGDWAEALSLGNRDGTQLHAGALVPGSSVQSDRCNTKQDKGCQEAVGSLAWELQNRVGVGLSLAKALPPSAWMVSFQGMSRSELK